MTMLTPRLSSWSAPKRSSILDDFDQLVENFLWPHHDSMVGFSPACDVSEGDDHYLITFDMPGVKREDVKIEVADNRLTISGERRREMNSQKETSFHRERSYGKFQRSFNLPSTVDTEKIEANFENGVLAVAMPKTNAAKGRTIEIQSGRTGIFGKLLGKKEANVMKDVKAS